MNLKKKKLENLKKLQLEKEQRLMLLLREQESNKKRLTLLRQKDRD